MHSYKAKNFDLKTLSGISEKTIETHLKLYEGYVKHVNVIHEKIDELLKDSEKNAYALGELQRRLGFEFCGMKNHEYYFESLSGGASELSDGALKSKIETDFGSFEAWLERFKATASMRGIGWAMLYYDKNADTLLNFWIDEQHLGHPTGLVPVLALDMWEHSYLLDYAPSDKKNYIEAFFENLNWKKAEEWFEGAQG
jgi:Fe-Mn family superoxide dismutase